MERRQLRPLAIPALRVRLRSLSLIRLKDERGIALVMAIGILLVLMIALTTVIFLSSSSARDAQRSNSGEKAYALAEAGLSDAIAQISSHYPSVTGGSSTWLTHPALPADADGGTTTWSGSFDSIANKWSLTGTGTARNPTGGGATIVRTATANVNVTPGLPLAYRYGFYMDNAAAPCSLIDNSGGASIAVYVASCLNLGGNASIVEPPPGSPPSLSVYVGGLLNMGDHGSASIGVSTQRILSLSAGTCKFHTVVRPCNTENAATMPIWAQSYPASGGGPAPTAIHADAATIYARANWLSTGANPVTCVTGTNPFDDSGGRDSSRNTVQLLASPAFDCTARNGSTGAYVGRLAWNPALPKPLTIDGTVFIDATKLYFTGGQQALYNGNGTIYVNGSVEFDHAGSICGPGPGSAAVNPCNDSWVPSSTGELLIWALNASPAARGGSVTPAVHMGGASSFEGGIVADSGNPAVLGEFVSDAGSSIRGPAIGDYGEIDGDGKSKAFVVVPSGAQGGDYALGSAYNFGS